MKEDQKPLVILSGEIRTPPLSLSARREVGFLIRKLQQGHTLEMPSSRPLPSVGRRCHELRVRDVDSSWRVLYRVDSDAVVIVGMFRKKTKNTPKRVIEQARRLLSLYDSEQDQRFLP